MFRKSIILLAILFVIALPVMLLAQQSNEDTLPPILNKIFSAEFIAAVGAVIGFVALIKNLIKAKGVAALAVAFVISMAYSLVNYLSQGLVFAIGVGLITFAVSAGIFKGTTYAAAKF